MERRTVLAIVLTFAIFFGWQKFYIEPSMAKQKAAQLAQQQAAAKAQSAASQAAPAASVAAATAPSAKKASTQSTLAAPAFEARELSTATGQATLGNGNRILTGWNLKDYSLSGKAGTPSVDLKSVTFQDTQLELAFDDPAYAYLSGVRGRFETNAQGGISWKYEDDKVLLTRELVQTEGQPYLSVRVGAQFKVAPPKYAFVSILGQGAKSDPEAQDRRFVQWSGKELQSETLSESMKLAEFAAPVKWIGMANRYFLFAVVNEVEAPSKGLIQPTGAWGARQALVYPVTTSTVSFPLRVYFGPKKLEALRAVEPTLDHTVDFGWFTVIAYPLLKLLKFFQQLVGNWGIAIVLLTLVVKALTFPLTYKGMKSMKKMSVINPQLQKLKEKYKDDKETLNREMLTLMRTHGYNPVAGCMPILIQMPVFFALYRVLYSSIELLHAPFGLWIADLSMKDPFYITPVVLTLTMWLQQKITPTTTADPAQAKMMQFMPVIFGVFMVSLPSGLTVYMLVNALTSIAQQAYLNKKLGLGGNAGLAAVGV